MNGHFPSAGWGYTWAPHPSRGVGKDQPGGWAYAILPQLEQQALFALGNTVAPTDESSATLLDANKQRLSTPVAAYYCPSRRRATNYAVSTAIGFVQKPMLCATLTEGCRIDYAINGGEGVVGIGSGPGNLAAGDNGSYGFPASTNVTGVSFTRSEYGRGHIRDGASGTYLIGEKHINPDQYTNGVSYGDDQGPFVSDERDSMRWGGDTPTRDRPGADLTWGFGGPHAAGFQMSMCDGSIHMVNFSIDIAVHRRLCNRRDNNPVDVSTL